MASKKKRMVLKLDVETQDLLQHKTSANHVNSGIFY
jgi:hypothetical protein